MTSTDPDPSGAGLEAWHAPPARAVRLHAGFFAAVFALCATGALTGPLLALHSRVGWRLAIALAAFALATACGAWVGARLRHQRWKLDADGLWLRTGRLWQRETRVPASRVQHVDLKHGPLERRFGLATLVVHTAAAQLSGITVRGLERDDAQALRDQLARQLDDAADAL